MDELRFETTRDVELPFVMREGKPDLASSYIGLPPEDVFLPSPRLLVEITFRDDVVVWSGFEQPHRAAWRYDELRPFVFDRGRHLSALDPGTGR